MEANISDAEPEITMHHTYRTGERDLINMNNKFGSRLSNELHRTEPTEFDEVHEEKITAQRSYTTGQRSYTTGVHILVQVEPGTAGLSLPRVSAATSASATPAVAAEATTTARIAATLPPDARRHLDSETLSSHSRANSVRHAAPRYPTGEASLTSRSSSLSLQFQLHPPPPAANNGGHPLYSPGVGVPVPSDGNSAKYKPDESAENGTAHAGQRTASGRKSRVLQPPAPTPREPLVVQAAPDSFKRLDAHAKAVSRQTMSTKTELLQLLFNKQVVRSDLDKVRCVTKLYRHSILV